MYPASRFDLVCLEDVDHNAVELCISMVGRKITVGLKNSSQVDINPLCPRHEAARATDMSPPIYTRSQILNVVEVQEEKQLRFEFRSTPRKWSHVTSEKGRREV